MAFTFAAFCYILALILCAVLIFFAIFHIIAFDELKTDYKNPIDQCNSLNPLVLPEYIIHIFFTCLFLFAAEWLTVILNIPLIAYHIKRILSKLEQFQRFSKLLQKIGPVIGVGSGGIRVWECDTKHESRQGDNNHTYALTVMQDAKTMEEVQNTCIVIYFVILWLYCLLTIKYASRPVMSAPGLYDPTSIMNADELNRAQKEGWVKLAFYLISFFYYLYSMIFVLVSA